MVNTGGFDASRAALEPAARRCLELAHRTVRTALAGGPRTARTARLAARPGGTSADSLPVLLTRLWPRITRAAG
ncbi:hypothetical protein [Kitasatospora sp. NPDC058218]|uniref:hypothetical protein n=1 Tax=Kitasatospora sp. NPDC058218 TaxID=3346385 RepID=UPI0036D78389